VLSVDLDSSLSLSHPSRKRRPSSMLLPKTTPSYMPLTHFTTPPDNLTGVGLHVDLGCLDVFGSLVLRRWPSVAERRGMI
jgi:hypothetical protein